MKQEQGAIARRIYLFGSLRVQDGRGERHIKGEKSQNLLAFLTLHPRRPHRREQLADLLWPEAPPERVRRSFSDTLYRLHKNLGPGWLVIQGEAITLQVDAGLWVDVWEFERLAASEQGVDLQKAVDLYSGDLLPEIYADWILAERELRRSQYLAALETLAARLEAQGELRPALLTVRRLILAEPLHEPAHQAYLRLLGRLQRYGEAFAHYDYLRRLLKEELAAEPLAETRLAMQAIERERDLAAAPAVPEQLTPFVGRVRERAQGLAAVEAALEGRGGILAVEGEAGVGKSRLLGEIAAGARWRGATVLAGTACEVPGESPFAPLASALALFLNPSRAAQFESLLPGETLAALAPLYPAWRERTMLVALPTEEGRKRFHQALRLFGERLARLAPVILSLDDLQWADPALWESLEAFAQGFTPNGGLVMLAYRRPGIEGNLGWPFLQVWDRAGLLNTISLEPLSVEEVAQLAGVKTTADPGEIHALTGGSPFLIHEWLAEPRSGRPRSRFPAAQRLRSLPPPARAALESAAVLGKVIPYQLWAETAGLAPLALAGLSEELQAQRWLLPAAEGYAFAHDILRIAVYEEIGTADRRALHARAARALEPGNARARAFHLDQAGLAAPASAAYRQAGEQDLARFAFREAQFAFDRALQLLPPVLNVARVEIALALAQICETTGDRLRQRPALAEALTGAQQLGAGALQLQARLACGRAAISTDRFAEAETHLAAALDLAYATRDRAGETDAVFLQGVFSIRQGRWPEAREHYRRALGLARALGDPVREAQALRGLGTAAWDGGELQEAVQWFEQALAIQRRTGERTGEMLTQTNLLAVFHDLGAWDRLIRTAEELLPETEALGNRFNAAFIRHMQGLAAYALGDAATAQELFSQAGRDFEAVGDLRSAGLTRNTLGLIAEDEGNFEEAVRLYHEALSSAETLGASSEAAYAQHDLGALLLRLDRAQEAIARLEAARATWQEQGHALLRLKSEAFLGLALLAAGDRARAEALAASGREALQAGIPPGEQPQGWLWALHRLLAALEQPEAAGQALSSAYAELQRQARAIRDAALRHSFFERVPLNRAIVAAHDRLSASSRVISVSLARREAPLGRPLRPEEFITVRWTVEAPEDEAIEDKTVRRRQRLKRLLHEAEGQGAAPTDGDLAGALGVSRRTILRDLQAMGPESGGFPTRKRKK
jgi:DNA-binding SARP family transcriptional activator/tetratricopeptide (TPR) repeat protein